MDLQENHHRPAFVAIRIVKLVHEDAENMQAC
jgi:hypothetical protein